MVSPLLATSFLVSYILGETFSLGIEKLIIKDPQLPKNFHNLKVIFITDIHHGRYSSVKRLEKMVKRVNELHPDLILLGGDYLQTFRRSRERLGRDWRELKKVLGGLKKAHWGSFTVLGNHDYFEDEKWWRREFGEIGIRLLHNEGEWLEFGGERIHVGGVGDLWYGKPNLGKARQGVGRGDFSLLLSHQPNFIDEINKKDGVNFVLAGHTHGVQISLFHYMPILPRRIARWQYRVGLVETPQARMLVSAGVGNAPPYFRFMAAPQIHLLTFKSAPRR